MKLSDEMKQELLELQNEAKELINKEGVTAEDINNKAKEIETLKAKIIMQENIEEEERKEMEDKINNGQAKELGKGLDSMEDTKIDNKIEVLAFAKTIAKKPLNDREIKALTSNTDSDGNVLIPQDIKTRINELKRSYVSLRQYVTVMPTTAREGSWVMEATPQRTPFVDIDELTTIPNVNDPAFKKLTFKIRDLGGLLPIPNHLLSDETGGLVEYLAQWFVKKNYATDNDLILKSDGTKGSQGFIGYSSTTDANKFKLKKFATKITFQDIKSILNKELPSEIAKNAIIITNQDGFDILDNMEDKQGRPYLQGDGTLETPYKIKGKIVVVLDNEVMPSDATDGAPFIIGDTKQGLVLIDRQQMAVATSKEAGFTNNSTIMRAIVREDTRAWDVKAVNVYYSVLA
ncbi:phage major capsid protein [Clostridium botulinum]|nr:phage major capsid protein [Clostridium botulinum]MBO0575107.1 phage major capsid protein [Clostridium botulinum]